MTRLLFPLLAAILLFSSPATAQPERGFAGAQLKRLEKLDLTADQKSALRDAMKEQRKKMIDLRAGLQKKRVDLGDLMEKETPDRKSYEALNKEIADLQLQQKMLLFDMRTSLMSILTPEQRKTWMESRGDGMKRMGRRGPAFDRDNDDDRPVRRGQRIIEKEIIED